LRRATCWNSDKAYLARLADKGVPIPATISEPVLGGDAEKG
jgi:hypothetical protein